VSQFGAGKHSLGWTNMELWRNLGVSKEIDVLILRLVNRWVLLNGQKPNSFSEISRKG